MHVAAQTPPSNAANAVQDGLQREEERLRNQQQSIKPQANTLTPPQDEARGTEFPADETPCFPVHDVQFDGERANHFAWLRNELQPYMGRCVGIQGLNFIVARLNSKLIKFGYATSKVTLAPQNLQSGVLRLRLNVGYVSQVRVLQGTKDQQPAQDDTQWGTLRNAMPLGVGDIVNVHDIEQGLEQMKRLPSQVVTSDLSAGEEVNSSVLTLYRQEGSFKDRLHGGLMLDNSGTSILGKPQLASYLSLDNPLGLNDIVNVSLNSNLENLNSSHRSQSAGLSYSIPWGFDTFTLSANYARFAQNVQGTTVTFLSSGTSHGGDVKWERTVWRTASTKFGVYADMGIRRSNSFLNDAELTIQDRRTSNVETGVSYKQLFARSDLQMQVGYRHGVSTDGAQDDLYGANDTGPTIRPQIWLFSGGLNTQFQVDGRDWAYGLVLRGQQSPQWLTTIDQMSLGNRYSVRGFDGNNILLAESGLNLRNELTTRVNLTEGLETQAVVALDWGRVWGHSSVNLVGQDLAGMAFGVRAKKDAWRSEVMLATPLYYPQGYITSHVNLYASLTYGF